MSWDFMKKMPWAKKEEATDAAKDAKAAPNEPELPDELKNLPKGMLPKKLLAFLKSPQGAGFAKKLQGVMQRMAKDGVDVKDEKAVKAWVESHKEELQAEAPPPQPTYVHSGPRVGRNDPCPCGSGKKFKKCCETKSAAA